MRILTGCLQGGPYFSWMVGIIVYHGYVIETALYLEPSVGALKEAKESLMVSADIPIDHAAAVAARAL